MIEYFEQLTQEEQEDLTDVIRLLYRQTFLLERKFDKRAGRLQYQREYRICEKHIDFLKMYFQICRHYIMRECTSGSDLYSG